MESKDWLVLIEAVTSHGPVNPKRRGELKTLFKGCGAGFVFVTAFLDPPSDGEIPQRHFEGNRGMGRGRSHAFNSFQRRAFLGPYEEDNANGKKSTDHRFPRVVSPRDD